MAGAVREMQPADYREGVPVRDVAARPVRDIVLAAVVGAAALWAVPKVLDYLAEEGIIPGGAAEFDYEGDDE